MNEYTMVADIDHYFNLYEGKAFTAAEMAEVIVQTGGTPLIPEPLVSAYEDGNEAPLVSYVASRLVTLQWWGRLEGKAVYHGYDKKIYYTRPDEWNTVSMPVVIRQNRERIDELEERVEELESRLEDQ
ncbi:hypothetical protein B1756_14380 [Natrarchaeobaculum aegyptiacum]|uniref:Uncharacterized protein n=2 Tax=Natrarchaeobaculum aegyptiacum TaxID=745377 RepID=A0A2Z2HUF5_9EURY|nr:hypothetical protein B1756_14380 [Natrarchaeobaculum aegyptiacum]